MGHPVPKATFSPTPHSNLPSVRFGPRCHVNMPKLISWALSTAKSEVEL